MKITGELNVTVHENKVKDKVIRSYTGGICKNKKTEDGKDHWIWCNVEVVFAMASLKEITERPLKLDTSYRIEVLDGFLSFRQYLSNDNKTKSVLQIVITDHKQISNKPIEHK